MSIFVEDNPYGYRININHPKILPLWQRYKKRKGIPINEPLSDNERFEFEDIILNKLKGTENEKGTGA